MTTMNGLALHFGQMYGNTNAVNHPSLQDRYFQLLAVFLKLQKATRKNDLDGARRVLPQLFAWTFACMNHFPGLDVDLAMSRKYPTKCGFCRNSPCTCSLDSRPDFQVTDETAINRSIQGWQTHIFTLYGENNRQRGLLQIQSRLAEEIVELGAHAGGLEYVNVEPMVAIEKISEEFADVLSWIMSLASFLEVNLESLILGTYGTLCPSCEKPVCICKRLHQTQHGLSALPVTRNN